MKGDTSVPKFVHCLVLDKGLTPVWNLNFFHRSKMSQINCCFSMKYKSKCKCNKQIKHSHTLLTQNNGHFWSIFKWLGFWISDAIRNPDHLQTNLQLNIQSLDASGFQIPKIKFDEISFFQVHVPSCSPSFSLVRRNRSDLVRGHGVRTRPGRQWHGRHGHLSTHPHVKSKKVRCHKSFAFAISVENHRF